MEHDLRIPKLLCSSKTGKNGLRKPGWMVVNSVVTDGGDRGGDDEGDTPQQGGAGGTVLMEELSLSIWRASSDGIRSALGQWG